MTEPHRWPDRLALPRADLALTLLTIVLTVLADLTIAIAVGTGIGIALRLSRRDLIRLLGSCQTAGWLGPQNPSLRSTKLEPVSGSSVRRRE
jgi:hypothetical protein